MGARRSQKIRIRACELAAQVMASRPEITLAPTCWSLAVFFESYIVGGSAATMKPFGPKKPTKLKTVRRKG